MALTAVDESYQLTSQQIIQIISDPIFYQECVAYVFMADMARERYLQYESEVVKQNAKGCNGCDDRSKSTIEPAIGTFVRHTLKLHEVNPDNLNPLRDHLCGKLGYRPTEFVLYYKNKGTRKKLTF